MIVLAIETATRDGSVTLAIDGRLHTGHRRASARTHAERLPGDAIDLLATHGRTLADVDLFAVITGPGSFTGLRVGVAAVQGFALAAGRRIVPVPTLEAMADGWLRSADVLPAVVVATLDGHRDDVFFAIWLVTAAGSVIDAAVLIEPRTGSEAELEQATAGTPPDLPVVMIGYAGSRGESVAGRLRSRVQWREVRVPLAEVAADTAARRPDTAVSPHAIRPTYIRRPDAELVRERRAGATGLGVETPARPADEFRVSRLAPHDDLSDVEALQRRSFTNPWGAEAIRWELANTDVARLYVLRGSGGRVVAYCSCWMLFDELHINSLAVDEPWRRRGLARRLLTDVFRESVAAGARAATLEVRQSNHAARALYEGLGFAVEAVRRGYYQQPREDALILWHRRLADAGV